MTPSYATAVLGRAHVAALSGEPIEGIFDDIGHAIGGAAKAVSHVIRDVGKGIGTAASDVVRETERVGEGIGSVVAKGATAIDHALMEAAKHVKDLGIVLHLAQIGISFIPGIGQGVSAAIGAGLALAEGKPITEALIAGVKGAMPGGPLVAAAVETGLHSAVELASGKRLDAVALDAVRSRLPGGDLAKSAFDTGLALAQAKKAQASGVAHVAKLVPHDPMALSAFAMTRRLRQGQPPQGSAHVALQRLALLRRIPPPPAAPLQRMVLARPMTNAVPSDAPHASHVVPILVGTTLLVAAGGGAWWWLRNERRRGG